LDCELESSMDHIAWGVEGIFGKGPLDPYSDRSLELGDEILFPGLFHPHKGESRNIPIVRLGNIAALREETVLNRNGCAMDVYLVESRSIGGLSGSPVFIDLAVLKRAHQPIAGAMAAHSEALPFWERFKLIGVIHGHFDWEDKIPDNATSLRDSKFGINTGIAIVIPSEKILENLEFAVKTEKTANAQSLFVEVGDATTQQANVTFHSVETGDKNSGSK
jgi:vacuolar-type H+-ATPase subunit F/Vma7